MNINLKIEEVKVNIEKIMTESQLPLGIIYYLFKDIYSQIERQYYASLNSIILKEQKKAEQQLQKENLQISQGQAN